MLPLNIPEIERQARLMRDAELQRIGSVVSARFRVYGGLLAASVAAGLHAASDLVSGNKHAHRS